MLEVEIEKLQANRSVIKARWFYSTAALLLGLLTIFDPTPRLNIPVKVMIGLWAGVLAVNGIFFWLARRIERSEAFRYATLLSIAQISAELTFLSGLMLFAGTFNTVIPILYIIPILEAAVLFERFGPEIVALISGLLVNGVVVLAFQIIAPAGVSAPLLSFLINNTVPLAVVYLLIGFFAAYLARLIKERGGPSLPQSAVRRDQLTKLEQLNKDLEKKANELYAKDLELTLANERLQTLEKAKSKFIAVTTHQLRTPLSAVKWTFEMLVKEQLGAVTSEQKEFIQKGYVSTKRIIAIVNRLLSADAFEKAGEEELKFVPVQLADLLDGIVFEFASQAESKHLKIEVLKPLSGLLPIELDSEKIRIVLENLIDNAIKYTPQNGSVTIIIDDAKINTAQSSVEIVISDSGVGIPLEDQKKIFQQFYRGANAAQMEPDGSGLGLFISRDIIERHHGTIWFVSEVGKGTSFHIVLPVRQPGKNRL